MIFLPRKFNNQGTAAVEFAILLPFMLIIFFGSFEVARYIMVVRKVENTTNDIGFLLSREGTVHDINADGVISSTEDYKRIEGIAQALVPMLMAPHDTDNYEVRIRAVARPKGATVARDNAGLMWSHKITNKSKATNKAEVSDKDGFSFDNTKTSKLSGVELPSSIYNETVFGDRAELVFEGQTFLLVNFAYGYDQIINNFVNYVKLDFSNKAIEKIATYAARSRWIDAPPGDGKIQANEFKNDMQICTNCSEYKSNKLTSGDGRQACSEDPATVAAYQDTSGCKFN